MTHRISLKSAWRMISGTPGGILWRRVFHRPTGLGQETEVWLVFEGLQQIQWLKLNGTLLFEQKDTPEKPDNPRLRLQIGTHLMADKNVLEAMFMAETQFTQGPLTRASATSLQVIPIEVYLEIEEGNTAE